MLKKFSNAQSGFFSTLENNREKRRVRLFVDRALRKNKIKNNGEKFVDIGRSFQSTKEVDNFIQDVIDPTFNNIEIGFDLVVDNYKSYCEGKKKKAEIDKNAAIRMLSESNPLGFIHFTQLKLKHIEDTTNKMKAMAEQDTKVCEMIDEAIEKSKNNENGINSSTNDDDIMAKVLKQKRIFDSLTYSITQFKKARRRMSSSRHSLFYPPKIWIIAIFYLISMLLLSAEVGITKSILGLFITDKSASAKSFYTSLYCIGIAASFVFIWKIVLDRLLHVSMMRTVALFVIITSVFIFLAFLFSSKDVYLSVGNANKSQSLILGHFSANGIILGVFSVSIAIANALLLREAWYLHHLIWKQNKYGKLKKLQKSIQKYSDKWNLERDAKQIDADAIDAEVIRYTTTQTNIAKRIIKNYKQICTAQLIRGYKEGGRQYP